MSRSHTLRKSSRLRKGREKMDSRQAAGYEIKSQTITSKHKYTAVKVFDPFLVFTFLATLIQNIKQNLILQK